MLTGPAATSCLSISKQSLCLQNLLVSSRCLFMCSPVRRSTFQDLFQSPTGKSLQLDADATSPWHGSSFSMMAPLAPTWLNRMGGLEGGIFSPAKVLSPGFGSPTWMTPSWDWPSASTGWGLGLDGGGWQGEAFFIRLKGLGAAPQHCIGNMWLYRDHWL
jgi:hypothetical protein